MLLLMLLLAMVSNRLQDDPKIAPRDLKVLSLLSLLLLVLLLCLYNSYLVDGEPAAEGRPRRGRPSAQGS